MRYRPLAVPGALIAVMVFSLAFLGRPALARSPTDPHRGGAGARVAQMGASGLRLTGDPPTTNFVYIDLRRQDAFAFNSSYVGLFHVQYNYSNASMQWSFRIAKQWEAEAGRSPVKFEYHVYTRGTEVNNYRLHTEAASYLFHSSIAQNFQFKGDAPWTHHSLHVGDTVEITGRFSYVIPGSTTLHEFWANYRIGIR